MATPKTNNGAAVEPQADSDGLWNTKQAAAFLGIQKGSLAAAIERTPYLKDNAVKDTYPGLEIKRTRLRPEDVKRFAAERLTSGRATSNGMRRWSLLLPLADKEVAEQVLSEKFGRTVTLDKAYKRKTSAASNGAVGSDSQPDDDGEFEDDEEDEVVTA